MARCRYCQSGDVRWVQNPYGRYVLVDVRPDPFGEHVMRRRGTLDVVVHSADKMAEARDDEPRYKLHVATCPARSPM